MRVISCTPLATSLLGFGDDGFEAPRAELAAQVGNDAEGAGVIAAFGDLDVGRCAARGDQTRRVFVVEVGGQHVRCALPFVAAEAALLFAEIAFGTKFGLVRSGASLAAFADFCVATSAEDVERRWCNHWPGNAGGFENRFELAGADHGIDFRDALDDFVAVAFDEASGDDQFLRRAGGFEARHLEDGVDGLLLGGVDEAAGVDDEDLGLFGACGQARAGAVQKPHHDFGVDEVFGAA